MIRGMQWQSAGRSFKAAPPLVSVIMPAWNGENYVHETIQSVINQSYENFEFIIIDDCSTDSTAAILSSVSDSRVRVLVNERNLGISGSLVKAIGEARGKYVARIDQDDVCIRLRLARQVRFMERNVDVDILGGGAILFGRFPPRIKLVGRSDSAIKAELLFRCPMVHPTVMFRASSIPEWYDADVRSAEDYDLWVRLAMRGVKFANLLLPLIRYRLHTGRTSEVHAGRQNREAGNARIMMARRLLGEMTDREVVALDGLAGCKRVEPQVMSDGIDLAVRLLQENQRVKMFDQREFRRRVAFELSALLTANRDVSLFTVSFWRDPRLRIVLTSPFTALHACVDTTARGFMRMVLSCKAFMR